MEAIRLARDGGELCVGRLEALGTDHRIALGAHSETAAGSRSGHEIDDNLVARERSAPRVHGDVAEESITIRLHLLLPGGK